MNRQDNKRKLPDGWRWVRLGEVCEQDRKIINPGTPLAASRPYLSLEHIESNTGRILRAPSEAMEDEGKSTTFAFDSRHILYGKLRPYLNKVALPDFEGRCTTELIPLLPRGTDRHFLTWVLRHKETVDAAMRGKTGSRMPRANMNDLLFLEIPLPPLSEQKRIAAILNEQMTAVEKARAAAEAQLETVQALPAAYLRAVFNSPEAQKWPRVQVAEVCEHIHYGFTARANFTIDEPRFLRITDIQNGNVDWEKVPGCQIRLDEETRYRLADGDIVFARTGGTTGKSFLIKHPPRAVFASYLIRLRLKSEVIPEFIYLFFQSNSYWQQIRTSVRGGAQPHVNGTLLGAITLSLPPSPEQRHIAATLNEQMVSVEKMRQALEEQLDAINKLPGALLRRAFSGTR